MPENVSFLGEVIIQGHSNQTTLSATIPRAVKKALSLQQGDQLSFKRDRDNGHILIEKVEDEF